jgi:hypothetical protein
MSGLVPAVVCSTHVTGLWVTRALGRRGVPVTVVAMDPSDLATRSRHAARSVRCGERTLSVEDLHRLLVHHAEPWAGAVLIATGDTALETLSRHRDELGATYRLAVPDWTTTRGLLRKDETARIAARIGIELPSGHGPLAEIRDRARSLPYPVVVKPHDSRSFQQRFGRKLFVARTPHQLGQQARLVAESGLEADVLDLIPGADSLSYNYTAYVDRDGEVVAELALRKLRKSPPFVGIGRVVATLDDATAIGELRDRTLAFLREARWHGPVERRAQARSADRALRPDRSQRTMLLRPTTGPSLRYRLRLDGLPGCRLRPRRPSDGRGMERRPHPPPRRPPERSRLPQDRVALLGGILAPYRGPRTFAVWSQSDPLPFFTQWARTLRQRAAAPRQPRLATVDHGSRRQDREERRRSPRPCPLIGDR